MRLFDWVLLCALSGVWIGIAGCGARDAGHSRPSAPAAVHGAPLSTEAAPKAAPASPSAAASTGLASADLDVPPVLETDQPLPDLPVISKDELARMEPGHRRMVETLRAVAIRSADRTPVFGDYNARLMRTYAQLLESNPQTPQTTFAIYDNLAQAELELGNEDAALAAFAMAEKILPSIQGMVDPESLDGFLFRIGVAHLRQAESQNCCQRNTPQSCILPIEGGGLHAVQQGARTAIKYFTRVLEDGDKRRSDESAKSELHYRALWLLNVAYMTLGEHPQSVPAKYLIPTSAFESKVEFPPFENIANELGLDTFSCAGGAIADDFDNDGFIDLVVSCWRPSVQMKYFRNDRLGGFTERSTEAGLTGILGGLNLVQGDYNNDQLLDIFVLRGGWLQEFGDHPNSLLRNNGDGTFTDVTYEAGLAEPARPTQTAVFADFNNDGNLDVYVGNESAPCQLFINRGDGTFEDRAEIAGVSNNRFTKAVVAGDYDNDNWTDIYVSNNRQENRLYHNNGNGTFTDSAQEAQSPDRSIAFRAGFGT